MAMCQPDHCLCLDGTKVKMDKTDFCHYEGLKGAIEDADLVASRMSKWAAEIVQCPE